MKTLRSLVAVAAASTMLCAAAVAAPPETSLVAFDYYAQAESAPAAGDAPPPTPPAAESPIEPPAAGVFDEDPAPDEPPMYPSEEGYEEEKEEEYEDEAEEEEEEEEEVELEICRLFPEHGSGWKVYGWLEQGFTTNNRNPANPAGGAGNDPLRFNYRNDEYMMNQLYTVIEREVDTGGGKCGCWDIGGRIDLLYGEDYLFNTAAGLETRQDFSPHWNSGDGSGLGGVGRYGLAMPQAYAEVAYDNLSVKVGHFYTIIGYEVVTAPDNFFYSHAYTMLYGEPFTHTGALATYEASDQWSFYGGAVNGWDKFDAIDDRGAFLGGATWTSCDAATAVTFALITGDEDGVNGVIDGNRTMYSAVLSHTFGCSDEWLYVFQHDHGWSENGLPPAGPGGGDDEWYGLNQYLFYTINDCWSAGLRYEWFNDQKGNRIAGDPALAGHYHELSIGLNWSPHMNVMVRPELRWDWFDGHTGSGENAFANGTAQDQRTFAMDVILHF